MNNEIQLFKKRLNDVIYENNTDAEKISKGELPKEELGIKAINDHELEITLETATPYFDDLLAFPSFLPQRQDIV